MTQTKIDMEIAERDLFTRFNNQYGFFSQVEFSPIGSHVHWDIKGACKDRQFIADIKVRTSLYDSLLIQKDKYEYLMSKTSFIPVYITIVGNKVFMIDLRKVQIDWVEEKHWVDSCKYIKKKKLVGYIPTSSFKCYSF